MTKELSAFLQWSKECEREAVIAVSRMFPDDTTFASEASLAAPNAALALDHLRALQADNHGEISDAAFWVAYHLLQRTLVG